MTASVQSPAKIPFKNVDPQSVPAFGVMQVTGSVVENGVTFLTCAQVGSTLSTEFAVNGPSIVRSGDKGICFRQGDLQVAYDGGSPQPGEGWGVRAGQWTLSKGYPSIIAAHGMQNAANHILYGKVASLRTVLGAADSTLPALNSGQPGTTLFSVHVWDGTNFVASTPAMTFTGYNISTAAIKPNTLTQFVESDGLWIAVTSEPALVRFELTQDLVYGTDPGADNARLLVFANGSYAPSGATIRVFDWTKDGSLGTWSGKGPNITPAKSGYQGWAVKQDDSNRYEIVWMESKAQFISFRLYQQLTTGAASQANCPVLSFWDGRDPDPSSANITVYNLATDYAGVYKFSGDANAAGYAVWNEKLGHYQICALEGDGRRWQLFKNLSGYTVPANGVMHVMGVVPDANGHIQKRMLLTTERTTTTFARTYAVNGYVDVPNNSVGVCSTTEDPIEAIYDSGTPANGETWGPKPGQFTLSKGFPGFTVLGFNTDVSLAVVVQEPIVQLLGKSTQLISAGASTSTGYKIYVGPSGGEFDGGWTTLPTIVNRTDGQISANKFFIISYINSVWYAQPWGC